MEIRDQGHGMTLDDLSEVFLRIGTNSRRKHNRRGAKHLGDKGIGRLSAMRIGDRYERNNVKSTVTGVGTSLDIDWSWFDDDERHRRRRLRHSSRSGADKKVRPERIGHRPSESQHCMMIGRITRFAEILQGKIARMLDPFEPGSANRLIVARHNGVRVLVPSIPTQTPGCRPRGLPRRVQRAGRHAHAQGRDRLSITAQEAGSRPSRP